MADIFWDRIEPHSRDPHIESGLAATIADPLWLLARQWQVGEFRGEDAGSPIDMRLRVAHVPLVSFRNEARRPPTAGGAVAGGSAARIAGRSAGRARAAGGWPRRRRPGSTSCVVSTRPALRELRSAVRKAFPPAVDPAHSRCCRRRTSAAGACCAAPLDGFRPLHAGRAGGRR